jgi:hypothetical protein
MLPLALISFTSGSSLQEDSFFSRHTGDGTPDLKNISYDRLAFLPFCHFGTIDSQNSFNQQFPGKLDQKSAVPVLSHIEYLKRFGPQDQRS